MFMQFDGNIDDDTKKNQLINELKQAGVKVIDIRLSRWRNQADDDIGGRIDLQIEDDAGTSEQKRQKEIDAEIFMNASDKWNKNTNQSK